MAKRKKAEFKTLHTRVPDVVTYTILFLLFLITVIFVQKMVAINLPWETL